MALLHSPLVLYVAIGLGVLLLFSLVLAFFWRVVVDTNKVHIVQSRKNTTSYGGASKAHAADGSGSGSGNVYYAIPSFIPVWGVTRIILPVNNFDLHLHKYQAYDKDRVPFELDVTAFFRISDTNVAAERVQNFDVLHKQLISVVQGAVRKILASHDINSIMTDRATFGKQFTEEVATELKSWGVEPVKNMELMDIRDADGSQVIANIMKKKSSHIEMESRVEVAENTRLAEVAEIEAKRKKEIAAIEAKQSVGERAAEQEKIVGIAQEKSSQEVKSEAATTKEREMKVLSVETQRRAEISKAAGIVKAEEHAAVTQKVAEGDLEKAKRDAEGVRVAGQARADAEKALQLAPVEAQIVLAKEIGENQGYQTYLVSVRQIEANQVIGVAQAQALKEADIKVIANTGDAPSGLESIGELLGSKGGLKLGALLEGLKNTPEGSKLLDRLTGHKNGESASP